MTARMGGLLITGAAVFVLASSISVSAKQDPAPSAEAKPPLIIRVGVDLIQIDAAATDQEGRPVKDLRAEDFSIEIDGRKQPVNNAMFFDAGQGSPAVSADGGKRPPRTVVFIVDDLNASMESMIRLSRAMKEFAAAWDFSDARVGFRLTSEHGDFMLLSNSQEKFDLAVSTMRFNVRSSRGPSIAPDFLGPAPNFEAPRILNANTIGSTIGNPPAVFRANYDQRVYSLLSTINALRSVPGRKALVLVSEGFAFGRDRDQIGISSPFNDLFAEEEGVDSVLHMVTEVANRASVVIYTLDPSGLVAIGPVAAATRRAAVSANINNHWSLSRLSEDTGGLSVHNQNNLKAGLSQIVKDQRAYYVLGFEPPKDAFEKSSGKPKFHEIKLRVNRPDVRVRTRAGFYGVTDDDVIQKAPLVSVTEH